MGIAFKGDPETNDTRGSVGVYFYNKLFKSRKNITIFDLSVSKYNNLKINNEKKLSKHYDVIIIMNNNRKYKKISKKISDKKTILIDFWK